MKIKQNKKTLLRVLRDIDRVEDRLNRIMCDLSNLYFNVESVMLDIEREIESKESKE
jgi:hypothetical protein